jgi:hypothetical protein
MLPNVDFLHQRCKAHPMLCFQWVLNAGWTWLGMLACFQVARIVSVFLACHSWLVVVFSHGFCNEYPGYGQRLLPSWTSRWFFVLMPLQNLLGLFEKHI